MEGGIHIYCINLKHRTDRWERFSKQSELQTLQNYYKFERFEGINGSSLDISKDDRISMRTKRNIKDHNRRDHEELDSAGGVGCYLSHTSVWKKILEQPEPYAIIFEDDAVIPSGFTYQLQMAMKEATLLPQIPDIWSFSPTHERWFNYKGQLLPRSVNQYQHGPWTTHECTTFTGYLISKEGARKLLETAFPLDMHVDMYTCLASELNKITYVKHRKVVVRPIEIKEDDTDIHLNELKNPCYICDIPTRYRERGMFMISLPVVVVALGTLATLWYLGGASAPRRR
jgi:GR25 family glycosyltransferase involved in LPS biosynthesis